MPELKLPFLGHGGDYNPDQWRDTPDILDEDIRLMKLSDCNLMSVGIFAWAALEPEEGVYDFDWLQGVLDSLHAAGISAFLATPSGARPAWMSQKYPEVLRVRPDGLRNLHGERHNHCFTSPVYRGFVNRMNTALARRFGNHPAVVGWHISNEYGGECHCEKCQQAFRDFLKARYGTLKALNRAWWTGFWSKTYTDWSQLHSPTPLGESGLHGLNLAWRRFVTRQTADFIRAEAAPLRELTPHLPVTTNLMELFDGLDYFELSKELDFASYDSYPRWGGPDDAKTAAGAAFNYDLMRSLKQKPFALMESTPSQVNWQPVCKLKKPGMHLLSSLQAVAHGADTVQYFQWRKSRGGSEKFHGAVVGHSGHERTRVFGDVQAVGAALTRLNGLQGDMPVAEVALLYDLPNRWALDDCQGPRREKHYMDVVLEHYKALKDKGVDVDVIDQTRGFDGYKLIVAPMLYMLRPSAAQRLTEFVKNGGTLVCTAMTGRVDEDDLCFLGGFPGPLREVLGIWCEDIDALYDGEENAIDMGGKAYPCIELCDLIHAETARVLGIYGKDFYAGEPCVTRNDLGGGAAYYIATHPCSEFLDDFYKAVFSRAGVVPLIENLPSGVDVCRRGDMLFVMNFTGKPVTVTLPAGEDALTGERVGGATALPVNGLKAVRVESPQMPLTGA
ncbi:MAG: beta-galactosidase [Clostridia bacterium]|nr:beta-galactosidase [Clostridia bacterium]